MSNTTVTQLLLVAQPVVGEKHCTWCDRKSTGGEVWLRDHLQWYYCNPTCYAQTLEGMHQDDRDQARQRYIDGLTAGHKALNEWKKVSEDQRELVGWPQVTCTFHGVDNASLSFEFLLEPNEPRNHLMVSSVRLQVGPYQHSNIRFWNRGGGTSSAWCVVNREDGPELVARLLGVDPMVVQKLMANYVREL